MSKEQIARNRYWNFRQLIKAAGGNNATARILGKNDSFVTAYGGKTPTRNIGDRAGANEIADRMTLQASSCVVSPSPDDVVKIKN